MEQVYAVIKSGGKQYSVHPGDVIRVEKLELEPGQSLESKEVLLVGGALSEIGKPLVANASVKLVVKAQDRAPKVIVFKKNRRKGLRRFKTHRQPFTELFVESITAAGKTFKAADEKAS